MYPEVGGVSPRGSVALYERCVPKQTCQNHVTVLELFCYIWSMLEPYIPTMKHFFEELGHLWPTTAVSNHMLLGVMVWSRSKTGNQCIVRLALKPGKLLYSAGVTITEDDSLTCIWHWSQMLPNPWELISPQKCDHNKRMWQIKLHDCPSSLCFFSFTLLQL